MLTIRPEMCKSFYLPMSKNCFPNRTKNYSTDTKLQIIYHNFPKEEAAKIINKHDLKRLFAPHKPTGKTDSATCAETITKIFTPFTGFEPFIEETDYEGKYGVTHYGLRINSKGKVVPYTYIIWHHISGKLPSKQYKDHQEGFRIYSAFSLNSKTVEEAFKNFDVTSCLQDFDVSKLGADAILDPFLLREDAALKIFNNTLYTKEKIRATNDITRRVGESNVQIDKLNYRFSYKISGYFLPAYIVQEVGLPPRIIPAIDINNACVFGSNKLSIPKTMLATFIATTVISLLAPQFAIPVRIAGIVGVQVGTAFWAGYGLKIQKYLQEADRNYKQKNNLLLPQSALDKIRIEATTLATTPKLYLEVPETTLKLTETNSSEDSVTQESKLMITDTKVELLEIKAPKVLRPPLAVLKAMKIIGLKESDLLTNDSINVAFEKITNNFKGSSREVVSMTQNCLDARRTLLAYVKTSSSDNLKSDSRE